MSKGYKVCAQDERYDHCYFCGVEIPHLISGQNVCVLCRNAADYDEEERLSNWKSRVMGESK